MVTSSDPVVSKLMDPISNSLMQIANKLHTLMPKIKKI